ncbi:MAG: hypothetical protein J1F11_03445 [Oscillospiraceae bacterium]|nr:hypothetical protein [Oscillospiraceae bacterium]
MQIALGDLGAAAYEKFQNPMQNAVQEVTNHVDILAKSITNGELSESFTKIATGMSDIASLAITLTAESVLPAVITSLGLIMDKGEAIITVVTGVAAAFAAYKIAAEVAAMATVILGEAISPLYLVAAAVVGALTGATVAFGFINTTSKEASFTAETLTDKIRDETDAIKEQRKAFEDLKKAQDEKIAADDAEADHIARLWNELQNCVDKTTGEVTSNNERASLIISLLNDNYGMNIEYIDNQIQGYKELDKSMDNYIDKLKNESRIRNGQASYDEAIAEYDKLTKRKAELEKDRLSAINLSNTQRTADEYVDLTYINDAIDALDDQIDEVDAAIADCESEMAEYEELFSKRAELENKLNNPDYGKHPAAIAGEAYAKKMHEQYSSGDVSETNQQYQTEVETAIADTAETFANTPETTYSIGNILSYDPSEDEETVEDVKDTMQELWDSVSMQESLGLISSEKAYNERLKLIRQYCPVYSDEWYSYYKTILDYQRDTLKEQVQSVQDGLSDILSEYQKSFSEIEGLADKYKNRLLTVGTVFSIETEKDDEGNETKTYTVENLTEQMNKMREYHKLIKELKERGVSEGVLSELTAFDMDDGMVFAENLANSSDAELEKISELYAERDKLASDLANDLYAPEIDKLNTELINNVIDQFGTLPDEIRSIGALSINKFAEGVLESKENLTETAQEFMDSFFTACEESISSGTIGMAELGQNIADILGEQDTYSIGYEKGEELAAGIRDSLDNIKIESMFNDAMLERSNVSAGLAAGQIQQNLQSYYGGASWSGSSGNTEKIVLENRDEITVKLDREVLGKTVYEWTKNYERMTGR